MATRFIMMYLYQERHIYCLIFHLWYLQLSVYRSVPILTPGISFLWRPAFRQACHFSLLYKAKEIQIKLPIFLEIE